MDLSPIINRKPTPAPWEEGQTIPWNEPEFSRRMLREHLDQSHDMASRRTEKIAGHIDWIHNAILDAQPSQVLDLCCGPGLYSVGLSKLGHTCKGIDFSPASIEHARTLGDASGVNPVFTLEDVRSADFGRDGEGYDLVMLIFGEFNVFKREEAAELLRRIYEVLKPGGKVLLEPSPLSAFTQPDTGSRWWSSTQSVFSDDPHIALYERFWDAEARVSTERYFILDKATCEVTRISASAQAYSDDEYAELLGNAGFRSVTFVPSLLGRTDPDQHGVFVITGTR